MANSSQCNAYFILISYRGLNEPAVFEKKIRCIIFVRNKAESRSSYTPKLRNSLEREYAVR